jgi:hypothetical protein
LNEEKEIAKNRKTEADVSEMEFYLISSEAFKKLKLPVFETTGGIFYPENNKTFGITYDEYCLYVNEDKVESIEFYVHEFTELTLVLLGIKQDIAHKISKEFEILK